MRFALLSQITPGSRLKKDSPHRHRINEEITVNEIRVLDADGALIGILTKRAALAMAEEREMDLVEIAPQAKPPVCKIIDYGKFIYELQKKEKLQKKNQQQQQVKEVRFKWRTQTHDFNFKVRHAREFIREGNKVKASVMFRGREITHTDIGRELLERFIAELTDVAKVDAPLRMEGKSLSVVLSPDKTKKK